jgi:hypothetical protein
MFRTARQTIRIALITMLFQFLVPAFVPLAAQDHPTDKVSSYDVQHTSVVVPTFLKEQDEKEDSDFFPASSSTPLLDFATHASNLVAAHKKKYSQCANVEGFLLAPSPSRLCTLLI